MKHDAHSVSSGEWEVAEDVGIMDTAQPASKNMGEVALVANNTLQDNGEVVLVVNEHLGTLGQAENEDIVSGNGPHAVGEAHVVEASNYLLHLTG